MGIVRYTIFKILGGILVIGGVGNFITFGIRQNMLGQVIGVIMLIMGVYCWSYLSKGEGSPIHLRRHHH